jgi:hypothetical protein
MPRVTRCGGGTEADCVGRACVASIPRVMRGCGGEGGLDDSVGRASTCAASMRRVMRGWGGGAGSDDSVGRDCACATSMPRVKRGGTGSGKRDVCRSSGCCASGCFACACFASGCRSIDCERRRPSAASCDVDMWVRSCSVPPHCPLGVARGAAAAVGCCFCGCCCCCETHGDAVAAGPREAAPRVVRCSEGGVDVSPARAGRCCAHDKATRVRALVVCVRCVV